MDKPVAINCNNAICEDESGIANRSGLSLRNDLFLWMWPTHSGSSRCAYNIFSERDSGRFRIFLITDRLSISFSYGNDTDGSKFEIGAADRDDIHLLDGTAVQECLLTSLLSILETIQVQMLSFLWTLQLLLLKIILVQSVYPYDPPFYNVIDATPKCYTMGLCPEYGEWGSSEYSVHPSSEERALHLLRNMARLFPTEYRDSKYGAREWGYKGSDDWKWDDRGYCGKAAEYPAYWYSMGNQAARWHQWDKFTCNIGIGHETCSNPNRCERFGSCSFSDRSKSFIPLGMFVYFHFNKTNPEKQAAFGQKQRECME